jgi:D-amino peptidase
MEGASQIADYKETLPVHQEYWQSGRSKFTADAVAAAEGLMEGGAKEVAVIDGHGLGWPNLIEEELPKGVGPFGHGNESMDFDGLLLVGFHARCGTPDGFMSHTFVPYLRVAINDALVTECHVWALRAGLPVLGITGDRALGLQLDGILAGTPFLEVKNSSSRAKSSATHHDPSESADAIRAFARGCVKGGEIREAPALAAPQTVSVSMPRNLTTQAEGQSGLVRKSPGALTVRAKNWSQADSAINAAMGAAVGPLASALDGLDLWSGQDLSRLDSRKLGEARRYFADWVNVNSPAWED